MIFFRSLFDQQSDPNDFIKSGIEIWRKTKTCWTERWQSWRWSRSSTRHNGQSIWRWRWFSHLDSIGKSSRVSQRDLFERWQFSCSVLFTPHWSTTTTTTTTSQSCSKFLTVTYPTIKRWVQQNHLIDHDRRIFSLSRLGSKRKFVKLLTLLLQGREAFFAKQIVESLN